MSVTLHQKITFNLPEACMWPRAVSTTKPYDSRSDIKLVCGAKFRSVPGGI